MEQRIDRFPADEVKSLRIEIGCAELTIESEDDTTEIQAEAQMPRETEYSSRISGEMLIVRCKKGGITHIGNGEVPHIRLTLPKEKVFEVVCLEVGAGNAQLRSAVLDCVRMSVETGAGNVRMGKVQVKDNLRIETGAGSVKIEDAQADTADVHCGVGSLLMCGAIRKSLNVDCGVGTCDISLHGKEEDYRFDVSCAIGSVTVNGMKISGLAGEHRIDNASASGYIHVSCAIGKVKLHTSLS